MDCINRKNYFDPEIFKIETEAIFKQEWLFAGFINDIPNRKDWITLDLFNHSIILYNTGTEIKAFQNVCAHRFNKIFTEESGNGMMMCKYHLWAYNDNGQLIGKKQVFPEPDELICLKSYPLEVIGSFIFVHLLQDVPKTLKEQLGEEITDQLLSLTERIHEKIFEHNVPHRCNWKFIIENVIENQHCLAIHRETLVKAGYCKAPPTVQANEVANSFFVIPFSNDAVEKKRTFIVNHVFGKDNVTKFYKHTYIYPNMLISDFEGINFNIACILPSDAGNTNFKMQFFIAKPFSNNEDLVNEYKAITIRFGKSVFEEDKAVLENLQSGVMEVEHNGYQYTSEQRVGWFIQSYNNSMKKHGVSTV